MNGCVNKINNYLSNNISLINLQKNNTKNLNYKNNLDIYISERCSNIYDELLPFRRNKKKLARIIGSSFDLLMEQSKFLFI